MWEKLWLYFWIKDIILRSTCFNFLTIRKNLVMEEVSKYWFFMFHGLWITRNMICLSVCLYSISIQTKNPNLVKSNEAERKWYICTYSRANNYRNEEAEQGARILTLLSGSNKSIENRLKSATKNTNCNSK